MARRTNWDLRTSNRWSVIGEIDVRVGYEVVDTMHPLWPINNGKNLVIR